MKHGNANFDCARAFISTTHTIAMNNVGFPCVFIPYNTTMVWRDLKRFIQENIFTESTLNIQYQSIFTLFILYNDALEMLLSHLISNYYPFKCKNYYYGFGHFCD